MTRLLVADDDPLTCDFFKEILQELPLEIRPVSTLEKLLFSQRKIVSMSSSATSTSSRQRPASTCCGPSRRRSPKLR